MKKESFLKGTLILIFANAVSKILGAVLKIPLTYILGEEGMAIYQTAFSVYIMLLSFITSGLPFAISKYISEELTKKHPGNVRFATRISALIMFVLGLFGTLIMYFGADFFALAMKDPKSPLAIRTISPAILFVALGAVYKSCYQGYSHMTPTAVSQVLESLFKLVVGYSLASWFSAFSVKYTSAAAIFGVTTGEAFATLLLFLLYIPYRRETRFCPPEDRRRTISNTLLAVAVPMTATSIISGSLSLLETSIIRGSLTTLVFTEGSARKFLLQYSGYTHLFDNLLTTKRLSFDGARWLFGAYSGYAMTVFNLPVGILASFGVSILPVVTRCITLKDYRRLDECVSSAFKIILVISLPCSAVLTLFSGTMLNILFKNTASAILLSYSAPELVIIALAQLVCSVQYCSGKIIEPFRISVFCMAVKIILSYLLIHIPELNITGVIISSFVAVSLQLLLNIRSVNRSMDIGFISFSNIAKALFSTVIMSITAFLLYTPMRIIIKNELISFAACIFPALLAYAAMIFGLDVIKKEEIKRLSH